MPNSYKKKSFWKKPEGVTGIIFLIALLLGAGFLISTFGGAVLALAQTVPGKAAIFGTLGVLVFMALDSKTRTLVSYMYKSAMRWITGMFIQIDPMGILKNYVDDLRKNLRKMRKQMHQLRGQMHKLGEMIHNNKKDIDSNIALAKTARAQQNEQVLILKSRKAGRLKESNIKLETLYKKMEVLYKVLNKMYKNSEILVEDIDDQVKIKEQEYEAIKASNSAMKSAMNIIKGDTDKRAMFDQALEAIADDVSGKVGEMENFMEMSQEFMESIDLQNGIFEEKGLEMLEKWEKKSTSLLLGDAKDQILLDSENDDVLDLTEPIKTKEKIELGRENQYDGFFD